MDALPEDNFSRYPVNEVTIELDANTVNQIINEITAVGNDWLQDTNNECFKERQQIMAYLLKKWITVGEEIIRLQPSENSQNRLH